MAIEFRGVVHQVCFSRAALTARVTVKVAKSRLASYPPFVRRVPLAFILGFIGVAALSVTVLTLQRSGPIVREEQTININGVPEVWRLEWKRPPKPFCVPGTNDISWAVCPCTGFAYGETGPMDLVRLRNGREIERLSLNKFFPEYENQVIMPRWELRDADVDQYFSKDDTTPLAAAIRSRPLLKIMNFADYDHDGQATEFLIQTEVQSCGHRYGIVVGVSKDNPRFHAFGTVSHPNKPLLLSPWHWDALKQSPKPPILLETGCGDHGSDSLGQLELTTTPAGIRAIMRVYECINSNSERGRLLEEIVR